MDLLYGHRYMTNVPSTEQVIGNRGANLRSGTPPPNFLTLVHVADELQRNRYNSEEHLESKCVQLSTVIWHTTKLMALDR